MKVSIIVGGIIGTTIAATLKKEIASIRSSSSSAASANNNPCSISIIDDQRQHQTSLAGQGYLWSIHRSTEYDVTRSHDAKNEWVELLSYYPGGEKLLCTSVGSLLIAADDGDSSPLRRHYEFLSNLLNDNGSSSSSKPAVKWIDDARTLNPFVRSGFNGIYYDGDYTCSPPAVIDFLIRSNNFDIERRTVTNLDDERELSDIVICCAGPWINRLKKDINVIPVRGLLLQSEMTTATVSTPNKKKAPIPMMEYGYGTTGVQFTLSCRDNRWLIGASREDDIGFSLDDLDIVEETILEHAKTFVDGSIFGCVEERRVGFRPWLKPSLSSNGNVDGFRIERDGNLILVYGFEGQGVLYAALAAKKVVDLILDDL